MTAAYLNMAFVAEQHVSMTGSELHKLYTAEEELECIMRGCSKIWCVMKGFSNACVHHERLWHNLGLS